MFNVFLGHALKDPTLGLSPEEVKSKIRESIRNEQSLREEWIDVESLGDEIILEGEVDQHEKKWLAEDLADKVLGVDQVRNNICVRERSNQSEE